MLGLTPKAIDWDAIEREYRYGSGSVNGIAKAHDISETAVRKHATAHGWTRTPPESGPVSTAVSTGSAQTRARGNVFRLLETAERSASAQGALQAAGEVASIIACLSDLHAVYRRQEAVHEPETAAIIADLAEYLFGGPVKPVR